MAHFAKIENGIVSEVVVVDNENEINGEEYLNSLGLAGRWIQTSYNAKIKKHFAGIGYSYSEILDAFIPPQPYPSWTLDQDSCVWLPPIEKPIDGLYTWDETNMSWIII